MPGAVPGSQAGSQASRRRRRVPLTCNGLHQHAAPPSLPLLRRLAQDLHVVGRGGAHAGHLADKRATGAKAHGVGVAGPRLAGDPADLEVAAAVLADAADGGVHGGGRAALHARHAGVPGQRDRGAPAAAEVAVGRLEALVDGAEEGVAEALAPGACAKGGAKQQGTSGLASSNNSRSSQAAARACQWHQGAGGRRLTVLVGPWAASKRAHQLAGAAVRGDGDQPPDGALLGAVDAGFRQADCRGRVQEERWGGVNG